jgi:hypothetical protein
VHTDTPIADSLPEVALPDRGACWLRFSVLFQVVFFMLHSAALCGCHFNPFAAALSIVPIGWGFYPFFCYRTRYERVVGYIAGALSIFWLYFAWDSNIQFAFQR